MIYCRKPARQLGFTLTEVMIAVAIVAILASIAYPSYLQQVRKSNRSDAKIILSETAQRLQRCFTAQNTYVPVDGVCDVVDDLNGVGGAVVDSPEGFYRVTATTSAGAADFSATSYTLTARPIAGTRQAGDTDCATFSLTQTGVKTATNADCW